MCLVTELHGTGPSKIENYNNITEIIQHFNADCKDQSNLKSKVSKLPERREVIV